MATPASQMLPRCFQKDQRASREPPDGFKKTLFVFWHSFISKEAVIWLPQKRKCIILATKRVAMARNGLISSQDGARRFLDEAREAI